MFLRQRFLKDQKFFNDYKRFMDNLLVKGYAKQSEVVQSGKTWYIPHHGVYHPSKPGKIRVVFDCSAEFQGKSINKELLSGPDLTNQIIGIMTRFREEKIAFMADIEAMYHQVLVPDDQQTFLKFLWWSTDDIDSEPQEFMMCAHVFGGTSSASCSNYALRRTAIDNKEVYGTDAATTLFRNFYMDELLKSVKDVQSAKQLVHNVINICKSGGFNLTKFMSNSKELLAIIPEEKRKDGMKDKYLSGDLPNDKALEICWNIEKDMFTFKINLDGKPIMKSLLSMISSMYNPLGFAAPFVLERRKNLQSFCNKNEQWDEIIQQDIQRDWAKWVGQMNQLENLISRCIQPADFGEIKSVTLHHFSDASKNGYGQCKYIRLVDNDN